MAIAIRFLFFAIRQRAQARDGSPQSAQASRWRREKKGREKKGHPFLSPEKQERKKGTPIFISCLLSFLKEAKRQKKDTHFYLQEKTRRKRQGKDKVTHFYLMLFILFKA